MYLFTKSNFTRNNFFNLILALIPLSFIAGNMIININLLLIIISAFLYFNKNLFKIRFYFLDRTYFYIFFSPFSGIINDYHFYTESMSWKGYFSTVLKSIFF